MRPTTRCVLLFAAGIGVALAPVLVTPRLWTLWPTYVGLLVLACGVDALFGLPRRGLRTRLEAPDVLYIGSRDPLRLRFEARRPATVELLCDLSGDLEPQPLRSVAVTADGAEIDVPLVPRRRGTARLDAVWLRWSGPLGLLRRQLRYTLGREIPVVPDIRSVRQAALEFFAKRDFLSGLKVERYIGDGTEFESLREYVPGLDHRAMNWKASARHRTLLCTNYRAERNHQVVLAVDSGHLMREPIDGVPKVDRAINAALHLAYVCLRTGDRVGLFAFDEKVRSFAEPDGGAHAFRHLQRLSADIDYSKGETNFTLGIAELGLRLKRRSLVVLLTDFVDTVTAELMVESLARLSRRHMVLFVTLRDPTLAEVADREPDRLRHLYRAVVAGDFVRERELVILRLQRLGVHCIDAPPHAVTTDLLNQYLEIKRRELF